MTAHGADKGIYCNIDGAMTGQDGADMETTGHLYMSIMFSPDTLILPFYLQLK